jgi:hypothetical protein
MYKNKTRKYKKYNFINRTKRHKKHIGGSNNKVNSINENTKEEREGILDMAGNKTEDAVTNAAKYVSDKSLRLFGLEPIKETNTDTDIEQKETTAINDTVNQISDATNNVVNDFTNVADKTSASLISNVNEVLNSPQVDETVKQAANDTAEISKQLLENFNESFNDPELKEEAKIAFENASDIATIGLKAMDKPIDEAIDKLNNAGTKAASGAISGLIKVGTDAMAAIPGVGAIIEVGKILNDGSKAVSAVVEAGTDATEATSDFVIDSIDNYKKVMNDFKEKKSESEKIMNRTNLSIQNFENPTNINNIKPIIKTGGYKKNLKTKRKFFKNKLKSKKVRFAV